MASLLRGAAAVAALRVDWTPEEAGRFAVARDVAVLHALASPGSCTSRRLRIAVH